MEIIISYLILYILFIKFEIIPLYKKKKMGEFYFYSFILFLTFGIHALTQFGIKVPSPSKPIEEVVRLLFNI